MILWYNLKLDRVKPSAKYLLLRYHFLDNENLFCFHMNFCIIIFISVKNGVACLIVRLLNLQTALGMIIIFTISHFLIHDMGASFDLLVQS